MALYHKWDAKNDFVNVLQFFSLISDRLDSVTSFYFTRSCCFVVPFEIGGALFGSVTGCESELSKFGVSPMGIFSATENKMRISLFIVNL